ncbi:NAD(P)-binding domain-containing protein [Dyadobacter chenwenxiniae]|uniref:NAD(P)-binding domain-containing protein n=1 Tax=Dyadobacter chenwenxiniae TaxID=2906456 RepID=A0A9X1PG48_9BACT|nr:NAD(P)-binding domain-containing protein [Dyadobacter chenwenxiniae]MCF0060742.1 NAD(P)-binding domain-containing protein [Dyadobacter chenwenxiniae]UON80576.1 NAD(P)-binding domain-containing protein [Dyadobacter chenwenxiniae]
MKIGIIGAGLIGKTLAAQFSAASHQVIMADAKGVESIQSIANLSGAKAVSMKTITDQIDLLVISVPLFAISELAKTLRGKTGEDVVLVPGSVCIPALSAAHAAIGCACRFSLSSHSIFTFNNHYRNISTTQKSTRRRVSRQLARPDSVGSTERVIHLYLTEAIAALPESYGTSDFGRATKGAALALRGKLALYRQDWASAEADFQAVRDMNYTLQPVYSQVFRSQTESNSEVIFSI